MSRLLQAGVVQAKLRVSQPGDSDETEADRAADNVLSSTHRPIIQRKCACGGTCSKCSEEDEQRRVPRLQLSSLSSRIQRAAKEGGATQPDLQAREDAHRGPIPGLIVEDGAPVSSPGQMKKSAFFALLEADICATADAELAAVGRSTKSCPYIEKWLAFYRDQSAAHIERALIKYAPEAAEATTARDYIREIRQRVRRAVAIWAKTGRVTGVPPGVGLTPSGGGEKKEEGFGTGLLRAVSGAGKAQFKTKEGAAHATDAEAVQAQLGNGRALDSRIRGGMESAFGSDFSSVRIHDDSSAWALSSQLNARAFTIGNDVAFSSGEYKPGTPVGDALIAHELAHVVQQGAASQSNVPMLKGGGDYDALEADADVSAVGAVTSLWAGVKGKVGDIGRNAAPRFKSGLRLQSCKSKVPTTRAADQRAAMAPGGAAELPTADLARELGYELDPSSRPAPPAPVAVGAPPPPPPPRIPWDGRTGAPGAAAARAAMQAQLFTAFDAYLTFHRPATLAALALPKVPMATPPAAPPGAGGGGGAAAPPATGVVDIANKAREVLETRYATSMDAAATSAAQLSNRSVRQATGPGQNIFDPTSEADRRTLVGKPDLAPDVAWWLFENDAPGAAGAPGTRQFATDILTAHHYSVADPGAEQFRWDVANAYAAAATLAPSNRQQLIDYRLTGWSERGNKGITLLSSFTPGANPGSAELKQRWAIFRTATHESLHLRTHPAFEAADKGRGTMKEGFVEMFTVATLNTDVLPRARAGSVEPLRRTVEGALSPAAPDATLITDRVTPAQYAQPRAQAERIRDGGTPPGGSPHAGVGEAAVRAAFFQGHVEYLGLAASGAQLATLPATGAPVRIRIPGGISGLDDLASRSGVARATIQASNPGITDALPPTAVLPGCREHWVVAGETRANIAAQNGVSEADLVRANPDVAAGAWAALPAGQKILIPVH
jgi:hypothetical protein